MYKSSEGEMTPVTLCYASDDPLAHSDFRETIDSMSGNFRFLSLTADFLTSKQLLPTAAIIFVDLSHSDFTGYQIIQFLRKASCFLKLPLSSFPQAMITEPGKRAGNRVQTFI